MADISKIKVGTATYYIKDAVARAAVAGGVVFIGITTTELTDGCTTNPIQIVGKTDPVTATKGNLTIYNITGGGSKEFIWDGSAWRQLGAGSKLGKLAYVDSASGSYTPAGSVTVAEKAVTGTITTNVTASEISGVTATFTGKEGDVTVTGAPSGSISGTITGSASIDIGAYTPAGTITGIVTGTTNVTMASYTPEGECSKPNVNITAATGSAFSSTTYTSESETLEFGTSAFLTSSTTAALAEAPVFTGTAKAPSVTSATTTTTLDQSSNKLTFTGTQKAAETITGSCTTTVSTTNKLDFTGAECTSTGKFTPEASTVTVNNFTPTLTNGVVNHSLTAPGQSCTLSGTEATITVTVS